MQTTMWYVFAIEGYKGTYDEQQALSGGKSGKARERQLLLWSGKACKESKYPDQKADQEWALKNNCW